jgi:hypothetical protein
LVSRPQSIGLTRRIRRGDGNARFCCNFNAPDAICSHSILPCDGGFGYETDTGSQAFWLGKRR